MLLGHRISKDGIEVYQGKIRNWEKLPFPVDRKGVRQFLGCCGYSWRFIEHYGKLALPLTAMLKDGATFEETSKSLEAMKVMKEKLELATAPVMIVPSWDKDFHVLSLSLNYFG